MIGPVIRIRSNDMADKREGETLSLAVWTAGDPMDLPEVPTCFTMRRSSGDASPQRMHGGQRLGPKSATHASPF